MESEIIYNRYENCELTLRLATQATLKILYSCFLGCFEQELEDKAYFHNISTLFDTIVTLKQLEKKLSLRLINLQSTFENKDEITIVIRFGDYPIEEKIYSTLIKVINNRWSLSDDEIMSFKVENNPFYNGRSEETNKQWISRINEKLKKYSQNPYET